MKKALKIILGILAVLIGMGLVLPAIAQWRQEGAMTALSIALLLVGAALTLAGGGTTIHGLTRRSI